MFQFKVCDLALKLLDLWLVFPHKVLQSANSALVDELLGAFDIGVHLLLVLDRIPRPLKARLHVCLPHLDLVRQLADEDLENEVVRERTCNLSHFVLHVLDARLDCFVVSLDFCEAFVEFSFGSRVLFDLSCDFACLVLQLLFQLLQGLDPLCEYSIDPVEMAAVVFLEVLEVLDEFLNFKVLLVRAVLHLVQLVLEPRVRLPWNCFRIVLVHHLF